MRKVATLVGLTVFALAGSAFAQDSSGRIFSGSRPEAAPAADTAAPAPAADPAAAPAGDPAAAPAPAPEGAPAPAVVSGGYASGGLTLAGGTFQATVPIVLNLSKEMVLKPVWVPLALSYGVTNELTVFLNHTTPNGAVGAGFAGLCLGGKDRGCVKANGDSEFYNNTNIGAQYSLLKNNGIELSGIGALMLHSIDPMYLAIDLGVGFKYVAAPISITVSPQIAIGANKRSEGNKEMLAVPLTVAFQATPELAVFLDSGIGGPTEHFGDLNSVREEFLAVRRSYPLIN